MGLIDAHLKVTWAYEQLRLQLQHVEAVAGRTTDVSEPHMARIVAAVFEMRDEMQNPRRVSKAEVVEAIRYLLDGVRPVVAEFDGSADTNVRRLVGAVRTIDMVYEEAGL